MKFALGGAFIGLAVAYLIASGTSETATYFLTVTEAASAERIGQVRVKGKVREGSVVRSPEEVRLTFVLTDNEKQLPVFYHGVIPDLFAEGREVIVEGRLTPQGLIAENLLASCPSKYEPEEHGEEFLRP
ncbi:MAG: cytochrome c maturation protein CcmE [Candidatus Binatia bacterium]